jgi:hypothetical protein
MKKKAFIWYTVHFIITFHLYFTKVAILAFFIIYFAFWSYFLALSDSFFVLSFLSYHYLSSLSFLFLFVVYCAIALTSSKVLPVFLILVFALSFLFVNPSLGCLSTSTLLLFSPSFYFPHFPLKTSVLLSSVFVISITLSFLLSHFLQLYFLNFFLFCSSILYYCFLSILQYFLSIFFLPFSVCPPVYFLFFYTPPTGPS